MRGGGARWVDCRRIPGGSVIAEHLEATPASPVVSAILPAYGRADVIGDAIASVLAQTFDDWELLVIDDASEVDLEPIVTEFDDPRVHYVRRQLNGGVAAAQNTGLDHARGEYVTFVHSDDQIVPEKLELQVALLRNLPDTVGAVESGVEIIWPDRTEHWPPELPGAAWTDLLAYRARVHIGGLLIRRKLAQQIRFDERLRGVEDRDFCIRLLQVSSVAGLQEVMSRVFKSTSRLGLQDKAPIYAYLLDKYRDTITRDTRLYADWCYRIARAHARAGETAAARQALRESNRIYPWRARRWGLWLATYGGDPVTSAAFSAQVRAAELLKRLTRA